VKSARKVQQNVFEDKVDLAEVEADLKNLMFHIVESLVQI